MDMYRLLVITSTPMLFCDHAKIDPGLCTLTDIAPTRLYIELRVSPSMSFLSERYLMISRIACFSLLSIPEKSTSALDRKPAHVPRLVLLTRYATVSTSITTLSALDH